jgi:MFS family permease
MDQPPKPGVSVEREKPVLCSACQVANWFSKPNCWLCGAPLYSAPGSPEGSSTPVSSAPNAGASTPAVAPATLQEYLASDRYRTPQNLPGSGTFTLGSLVLVVALFAVCFAVMRLSLGFGIGLAIAATPALIRTAIGASRRNMAGRPMDMVQKMSLFLASLSIVMVTGVASAGAFTATCFPIGLMSFGIGNGSGSGMWVAISLGVVAGAYVCFLLLRHLWPQKD